METKKTYKSFRFKNSLIWNTGLRGRTTAPGKPEVEIGSPTEFRGTQVSGVPKSSWLAR